MLVGLDCPVTQDMGDGDATFDKTAADEQAAMAGQLSCPLALADDSVGPDRVTRNHDRLQIGTRANFGIGHYRLHFGAPGNPRSKHVPSRSAGGFASMIFASLVGCWSFIQSPRVVASRFVGTHVPLGIAHHTERRRLNAIDLVAGLGIEPLVCDDPGPARVLASEHCRVAGAGLGQAVGLIGVAVNDAFID